MNWAKRRWNVIKGRKKERVDHSQNMAHFILSSAIRIPIKIINNIRIGSTKANNMSAKIDKNQMHRETDMQKANIITQLRWTVCYSDWISFRCKCEHGYECKRKSGISTMVRNVNFHRISLFREAYGQNGSNMMKYD